MDWHCAEVRDRHSLDLLRERIVEQTRQARLEGLHRKEARVYIAPYKAGHRLFFNPSARAMLPVLQGLAHAPCHEPAEQDQAELMFA